jgi:DNA-binding transcriptional ArsR family regulator
VLRAIGGGCRTSELAARLGVTARAASAHASALREAGLLVTVREGRSVRHTLTGLGSGLLEANPQPTGNGR